MRNNATVTFETVPGAPAIPTGTQLQFEGDFQGLDSKKCSINPVSSGVYSCSLSGVYFTSPGEKIIRVSYPEARYFYADPVDFPTMHAVSVSPSGLTETSTVITSSDPLIAGNTVRVYADTIAAGTSLEEQLHLFYTYNFTTKERVQTCMETSKGQGCELTLTRNTDWVYAEYLGNSSYAPNIGSKQVEGASSGSPVTLNVTIGSGN